MKNWYSERKQANVIEKIFNKIILTKFDKEYNELITFDTNNIGQRLVFNSNDLMSKIYQYLEWGWKFNGDLFQCSLVSSHWLYHAWNINSVYHVYLIGLIEKIIKCKKNEEENNLTRLWQRLINAKSIHFSVSMVNVTNESIILNKLSRMRNVERVCGSLHGKASRDMYMTILT